MPYLKDIVKQSGGTLHLKIEAIGSVQTKQSSNGSYEVRPVTFSIPATGKQLVENVYETAFSFDLSGVTAGMHVEAYTKVLPKTGKEVVGYRVIKSDAETSSGQTQTSQQQVKGERAASDAMDEQAVKSISICLQGFMQAYVVGPYGANAGSQEMLLVDAVKFAEKAREALLNKAKLIYAAETLAQD